MITRTRLRRLVESVLLEGYKDDQRYLVEKYPDRIGVLSSLAPKWIAWLIARFGENPRQEEVHPFEDTIVTIEKFAKRDSAIGEKYRSNQQFKDAVDAAFPPGERSWSSPADIATMSVDDMEKILGLSERKKQRFRVDAGADNVEGDRIGKVGPWNLWLPTTREHSCKIAGYDPVTMEPKTTWCTARTAGSNLFYNYVGRAGEEVTLFYIIRDNPTSDQDWLSVGFVNGKPTLDGEDGGLSVDRANVGLTPDSLKKILGADYNEIMHRLKEKNKALGGRHPAREKVRDAAKSVEALKYLTAGLSAKEASDLRLTVTREPELSPDVLRVLAGDEDRSVRGRVVANANTPVDVLMTLVGDKAEAIRTSLASNSRTPADVLRLLADDKSQWVRNAVASNPNTPADVMMALAGDKDGPVRMAAASNANMPADVLKVLAGDKDWSVRRAIASNANTPVGVLKVLAGDKDWPVRGAVATNANTPVDVLKVLAGDEEEKVRAALASRSRTPADVLMALANDKSQHVRNNLMNNPSLPAEFFQLKWVQDAMDKASRANDSKDERTPADRLLKLASDEDQWIRYNVSNNRNAPADALRALAGEKDRGIRYNVATNANTPEDVLRALAEDEDMAVSSDAKRNLKRRGINEARLRRLIRGLL
jgi:hypothetical protein